MKYIRTKNGIYEIKGANLITKSFTIYKGKRQCFVKEKDIIKQADKLEELIQTGDLVEFEARIYLNPVVAKIKVNKVSYIENGIELSVPGCIFGTRDVNVWWIQLPNGDFHKVAIKNSEGELELL